MAMTFVSNLALLAVFFFFSSGSAIDLGGLLSQGKSIFNQVKGDDGGLNITGIESLLSQATGADIGGVIKQVKEGEGLSLDTILGFIKKDKNGTANVANILGKFGYSVKDVLQMLGLRNDHVATVAEQFIADPGNLDKSGVVALCEGLEVLKEEKPQVGSRLAMLGMEPTTIGCPNR